ncbi:hypothetical protein OROHE_007822 [Orobanche hederae]
MVMLTISISPTLLLGNAHLLVILAVDVYVQAYK